jgi:cytochrome P450
MSRDPRYYKNPEVFDPTRFLGSEPELDPRVYFFGFGRRICPGMRHMLQLG